MYSKGELREIYNRTSGRCHICRKKLALTNYGRAGERGAWEVDHSVAKANGGTDYFRNLRAACVPCNRSKQDGSTRTARARHGHRSAPLSKAARSKSQRARTVTGLVAGGVLGARLAGPAGAVIGALIGSAIGAGSDPDPR